MKRPWLILVGGLLLAALAYGASYLTGSTCCRNLVEEKNPELSWLKSEFHLSDAEFARIEALHTDYTTACAERCRRIDAKNAELRALLSQTNGVTPAVETALRDAAQLRAECQRAMLEHFYEVSRSMPPDQGKRYFDWVVGRTLGSEHEAMTHGRVAAHEHPGK